MNEDDERITIDSHWYEELDHEPPTQLICCPPSRHSCIVGFYVGFIFFFLFGGILIIVWLLTKNTSA